jgi:hypothetical protein
MVDKTKLFLFFRWSLVVPCHHASPTSRRGGLVRVRRGLATGMGDFAVGDGIFPCQRHGNGHDDENHAIMHSFG